MPNYKLRIDLNAGVVEASGDEDFVRLIYDDFKERLTWTNSNLASREKSGGKQKDNPGKTGASKPKKPKEPEKSGKKSKAANRITPERFDIHGGGDIPSLEQFIKAKQPGKSNAEKIAVIGYYIVELLEHSEFNEGQVEYAYKMLGFSRPGHLRQIMINAKNQHDWYEPTEELGAWNLTRSGDIFVSEQLPKSE